MTAASAQAVAPRLEVVGLAKRYGASRALTDVDLAVAPGEVHALCGHNGAGKSTLVKVLAGVVRPDEGSVRIDGRVANLASPRAAQRSGIAVVDQEISLIGVLSVAENLLLGRLDVPFVQRHRQAAAFVSELLARVGLEDLHPGTPVASLSMGQRQLVEIARALGRDARVLLLDEPTATLSDVEIERVFGAVRRVAADGGSVLFVSHRLGEVLELCDSASVLRDGEHVATVPTAGLERADLIEMMLGGVVDRASSRAPVTADAPTALTIRGLRIPNRVKGLDLDVRRGQIVALAGQVGSGASECLRCVAGLVPGADGQVVVGDRPLRPGARLRAQGAGVLYLSGDRKAEGLFMRRGVARNLVATRMAALTRLGFVRERRTRATGKRVAALVGLGGRERDSVATLSGGNQQKAFLGRCLDRSASVLLLDEPTRGVDVGGREEIHALIRGAADAGTAVVFASTELDEILDLADVVVALCAGEVASVRPRDDVTAARLTSEMTHARRQAVSA